MEEYIARYLKALRDNHEEIKWSVVRWMYRWLKIIGPGRMFKHTERKDPEKNYLFDHIEITVWFIRKCYK